MQSLLSPKGSLLRGNDFQTTQILIVAADLAHRGAQSLGPTGNIYGDIENDPGQVWDALASRFLPNKFNQLDIFVIWLVFTSSWVNKNHQKLIFKVIFFMSKIILIILIFFSVNIIGLGEQVMIKPFFDNFIFWNSLLSKIGPYFYRLTIKWAQFQSKK